MTRAGEAALRQRLSLAERLNWIPLPVLDRRLGGQASGARSGSRSETGSFGLRQQENKPDSPVIKSATRITSR
ncbi:hypothetical protein NDU88_002473 [Pleurodeles waltl]|uniref:Uncharacterized protein n=1 Tax=Pleurodeles waltl TaxID=8319 RepID=A0AAV7RFH0_PLEWA|nr:hypothetical protein NDU88_002473 [Pleurodeles waltl]